MNKLNLVDNLISRVVFGNTRRIFFYNGSDDFSDTVQGSKFVVAMVANATMFSHLLPGCSCGSKHWYC